MAQAYKCDRCGKLFVAEKYKPEDLFVLLIKTSLYDFTTERRLDLCDTCQCALDVFMNKFKEENDE